jgi:hypothetical protein
MQKIVFNFIFILFTSFSLSANEGVDAITEDGQGVVLYSNGTWAFKLEPILPQIKKNKKVKILPTPTPVKNKKVNPKSILKGKHNAYKIVYDNTLWKKTSSANDDAEIQLEHKAGNGFAMVIFDRSPISLEDLKKQVLTTMRSVASKVEIISEEKKRIKGHQIMLLKINSTIEDTPFSYFNYYASGKWGTIQFVTYTASALMADYEADFTTLLDGLVIK